MKFFEDNEKFLEFVYIFETMITIANKYSSFIASNKYWKGPATLFGTTEVTPPQKYSSSKCVFDEYAKYIGEHPARISMYKLSLLFYC